MAHSAASEPKGWQPIAPDEVKAWRRDLPKGHRREVNTAHTVGLDQADSEGDAAFVDKPPPPVIDDPRAVVAALKEMAIKWATSSRENAALTIKLMRASNPEAFRHRSDEELLDLIVNHYEQKIQEVTEQVYRDSRNRWDKSSLIDVKDGVWRP